MSKKATNETKLGSKTKAAAVTSPAAKPAAAAKAVEKKAAPAKKTQEVAVAQAQVTTPAKAVAAKAVKAAKPAAKAPKVVKEASVEIETAVIAEIPSTVTLIANVDVGFGNTLYVRGEGPGLSWDKGTPLENKAADRWQISIAGTNAPVVFKFLINDQVWSLGEDYVAAPGSSASLSPVFE